MSSTRFWVIRWVGDQFQKDFLCVLPARWHRSRVEHHMKGLYFNSPSLLLISERTSRINSNPDPMIQRLGPTIIVGDNPFLVGYKVQNLTTDHQTGKGIELISYTGPTTYRLNKGTGLPEIIGTPQRISFERKISEQDRKRKTRAHNSGHPLQNAPDANVERLFRPSHALLEPLPEIFKSSRCRSP
jgi:hypothetical protein